MAERITLNDIYQRSTTLWRQERRLRQLEYVAMLVSVCLAGAAFYAGTSRAIRVAERDWWLIALGSLAMPLLAWLCHDHSFGLERVVHADHMLRQEMSDLPVGVHPVLWGKPRWLATASLLLSIVLSLSVVLVIALYYDVSFGLLGAAAVYMAAYWFWVDLLVWGDTQLLMRHDLDWPDGNTRSPLRVALRRLAVYGMAFVVPLLLDLTVTQDWSSPAQLVAVAGYVVAIERIRRFPANRVLASVRAGRPDEASRRVRFWQRVLPHHMILLLRQAKLLYQAKRCDEARPYLNTCLGLSTYWRIRLDSLHGLLLCQRDADGPSETLIRLALLTLMIDSDDPGSYVAFFTLGNHYLKMEQDYNKVLEVTELALEWANHKGHDARTRALIRGLNGLRTLALVELGRNEKAETAALMNQPSTQRIDDIPEL